MQYVTETPFWPPFLPRDAMLAPHMLWLCVCMSVCLSVSVTGRPTFITQTTPSDKSCSLMPEILVKSQWVHPRRGATSRGVGNICVCKQITCYISKTVRDRHIYFLPKVNRKQSWTRIGSIHGLDWIGLGWIGLGRMLEKLGWIGLDWVIKLLDWVGLDLAKWTHVQLW